MRQLDRPCRLYIEAFSERELHIVIEMVINWHRANARLKCREIFGRAILDSISAKIAVPDSHGMIIGVNHACLHAAQESRCESDYLIANSLKHGFPDRYGGEVRVSLDLLTVNSE